MTPADIKAALEKERDELTVEAHKRNAEMEKTFAEHNQWATQTNARLTQIEGGLKVCNALLEPHEPQP